MKRLSVITSALLVVAFTAVGCKQITSLYDSVMDTGWTTLIDGEKGLENFNRIGDANWRAEDGAIVADKGKGGYLVSKSAYKDFQIRAEFWADHTTNSGVFFRLPNPQKGGADNAYEANIYDQPRVKSDGYGTGAITNFAKVSPLLKAGGKWNAYLITAKGTNLIVELNGVQTANIHDSKYASGPIALQFGNLPKGVPGGAIKWRKVQIKEL